MTPRAPRWLVGLAVAGGLAGCGDLRDPASKPPVYEGPVAAGLSASCGPCHLGDEPEAGWSIGSYLETVGCLDRVDASGLPVPATLPADERAPVLAVLADPEDPVHGALDVPDDLRAALEAWVRAETPARRGAAHPPGFVDPRAPDFHGAALRSERWARMIDDGVTGACGGCHAGAPNSTGSTAPGATSCASAGCHDAPDGPLDCGTCHGLAGARDRPPPDPCLLADRVETAGAHLGHPPGVACETCHPTRTTDELRDGPHGDGVIDVAFDEAVAGVGAAFDPQSRQCTNACHARGGDDAPAIWARQARLDCQACHLSPPADHFPGSCTTCHLEANADGTAIVPGRLHGNGRVDLGTGSDGCGACHGDGEEDPWPESGGHPAHRDPALSRPFPCSSCHAVPDEVVADGHLNGTIDLVFGGLAVARGQTPTFAPPSSTCAGVACHGAGLGGLALPEQGWGDPSGAPSACGACHGTPPPAPHPASTSCASRLCHGGEVGPGPSITEEGRDLHVDGRIQPTESAP